MNLRSLMLSLSATLFLAGALLAAQPQHTEITVKEMHCAGCAKKIAAQLYTVPGVKEVRANVEKKLLFILPAKDASLSPRAMWAAVEKSDVPIRLVGPSGTFTSEPKF